MSQEHKVVCPSCGRANATGVVRCTGCHACLRPGGLGILAVAGVLLSLGVSALILWGFYRGEALLVESMSARIAVLIAGLVASVLFFKLGHGRRWAWVAMQGLLAVNIVAVPVAFVWASSAALEVVLLIDCVIAAAVWYYLRRDAVKKFYACSRET